CRIRNLRDRAIARSLHPHSMDDVAIANRKSRLDVFGVLGRYSQPGRRPESAGDCLQPQRHTSSHRAISHYDPGRGHHIVAGFSRLETRTSPAPERGISRRNPLRTSLDTRIRSRAAHATDDCARSSKQRDPLTHDSRVDNYSRPHGYGLDRFPLPLSSTWPGGPHTRLPPALHPPPADPELCRRIL